MRTIEYTNQFKRDWKREQRGKYRKALQEDFPMILQLLLKDQPLPERCFDHALAWQVVGPSRLPHQAGPRSDLSKTNTRHSSACPLGLPRQLGILID